MSSKFPNLFSITVVLIIGLSLNQACALPPGHRYTKKKLKDFDLIILHTNDLHSHDLPFNENGHLVGGLSKIAYLVSSIKHKHNNVIVIDAGDFFQGTPLFQRYGGAVEIEALNEIGYDVVELGNHEFDKGAQYLANQLKQAKFPVLACNLDCSSLPALGSFIKAGMIKEINGEKIALIGVITPDLEKKALGLEGVKVKAPAGDWMQPVKEEVEYYQNQGIDKIIVVSHCGVELDKALADAIPSIDLIVGGHSHTTLKKPFWVAHPDGNYTAIVQTGCYGRALGDLDLKFDQLGHLIKPKTEYKLISINSNLKEDPQLETYLQEKEKPLLALANNIIGFSDGTFWNHFANMPTDSAIGNLICDAMAEATVNCGVQITFQNRGGIRAKLEKGPISEEKIQEILPFDNKIICATVSGEALLSLLKYSLSGPHYGAFFDVHGLKITYDPESPPDKRIISVLVQNAAGDWLSIEKTASYKIAVNDYNFKGGDGYNFSKATDVKYTDEKLADALRAYITKHKHIRPSFSHRIMPVSRKS